jgi:hypothetical protein
LHTILAAPEKSGKTGLIRTLCAIIGGLLTAYSGMTLMVFMIPAPIDHAIIVPFLFTPFAWAMAALWISLAPNRINALLRGLVPSAVFAVGILILFARSC